MSKQFHLYLRSIVGKILFDERLMLKNIFEYCQNEMLIKQGVDFSKDERYQYYRYLHKLLNVMEIDSGNVELCRVGKDDDGGYIMMKEGDAFSSEKIAYSFGICDDVSWDLEMAKKGYEIFQYDHTIKKLPCKNKAFHWKKVGLTGGG